VEEQVENEKRVPLRNRQLVTRIPVMTGSILCHLTGKTPQELEELGENPYDPLGYYINFGTKRTINTVEQLRYNRIFMYSATDEANSKKMAIECTMTCYMAVGPQKISIYLPPSGPLELFIHYFGRSGQNFTTVNVLHVFGLLSSMGDYAAFSRYDYQTSLDLILSFIPKANRSRASNWLIQTIAGFIPSSYTPQTLFVLNNLPKRNDSGTVPTGDEERWRYHYTQVAHGLYPQIPVTPVGVRYKMSTLAMMCARLLEHRIGIRKLTDRDSYKNKMLKISPTTLMLKFSSEWLKTTRDLRASMAAMTNNFTNKRFLTQISFGQKHLSDFEKALSNNKYLSKNGQNLTEPLKLESVQATVSHQLKIIITGNEDNPNIEPRMVKSDQIGFVDPGDTPEGSSCGHQKVKGITCWVTHDTPSSSIRPLLTRPNMDNKRPMLNTQVTPATPHVLLWNGRMLGWCNGKLMRHYLRSLKLEKKINPYTTIVLIPSDHCLYVHTDAGRPTRPLLVLDEDEVPLFYKDKEMVAKWEQNDITFEDI